MNRTGAELARVLQGATTLLCMAAFSAVALAIAGRGLPVLVLVAGCIVALAAGAALGGICAALPKGAVEIPRARFSQVWAYAAAVVLACTACATVASHYGLNLLGSAPRPATVSKVELTPGLKLPAEAATLKKKDGDKVDPVKVEPDGDGEAKRLSDGLNALYTQISSLSGMFSMLLAIFALVLAFVTSWLMAAVKDGREQLKVVEQQLGMEARLTELQAAGLALQAQAALEERASLSDPNTPDAAAIFAVRRALRLARDSTEAHADLAKLGPDLRRINVVIHNGWPHLSKALQQVLRREVAPLPKNLLQRAATLNPQLLTPVGAPALEQIKWLWRLLDSGDQ